MKSFRPKNINEVKECLLEMTENSKFIGGGTDYIIRLKLGPQPDTLCYLGNINEYKGIYENENRIIIGSYTTMMQLEESEIINKYIKALADAASDVGSLQIRNNATIGGNIGNASPAGDLIPILYLLDATIETISPEGQRQINIKDVIIKPGLTCLNYNEAIAKIIIPKPKFKNAFVKLGSRKKVTISRIGVAVGIENEDNIVKDARIYIGAIGIKPVRLDQGEKYIIGKTINEVNILKVAGMLSNYIQENTPEEFDRDYKAYASKGVITDVFEIIQNRI